MTTLQSDLHVTPAATLDTIRKRVLVDGFEFVLDPQASHGAWFHDALSGKEFFDFYAFFAAQPVHYNHPRLRDPEFQARLLTAATTKVANSDMYTQFYADFVQALDEVAAPKGFEHFFFIDGGALAVENALKAAFDWKVRKNMAAGRGEIGTQVLHFRKAFHGRTGYTLSITDTDPVKTMYFPKFDWPRIDHPTVNFALPEPQRSEDAARKEAESIRQIEEAIAQRGHHIACLIIEPIQGEGGDNHARPEFFKKLREICDQHEILLIFDEVQTGVGMTGKMWAHQHFGVQPDIISFGKKMQVCGIMAGPRVDEVDNVFKVSGRINSTWGGNVADMVRSTQLLRIIQEEKLVARAAETGAYLLERLHKLAEQHECLTNVRGRGLMCAIDLPSAELRNRLRALCWERRMLVLGCGAKSVRFRPVLDITRDDLDTGLDLLTDALGKLECGHSCNCG